MFIERIDYNKVITIKLVIPGGCNAKCPFCYNKDKKMTCNKAQFLENFIPSLDNLLNEIGDKNEVSVDITGGEPTLDYKFLIQVLTKLREYNIKSRVLSPNLSTILVAVLTPILGNIPDERNSITLFFSSGINFS